MYLNLKRDEQRYFKYNEEYLNKPREELNNMLDGEDYMNTMRFAKKMMTSQEIRSNNLIEGINDDLSVIEQVIKTRDKSSKRIINLYHGYQYILTHSQINKQTLKELYAILSDGLLDPYSKSNMGEYYRERPVYILKNARIDTEPDEGVDYHKIDYYMSMFFEYASTISTNNSIDNFIKSQIMHLYFVYIHPYFDVNGRTSRTVAMWYLLNREAYPYIIFNRAIAFNQKDYDTNIGTATHTGDLTLFLKYMLEVVEKELECEYLINSIYNSSKNPLTKEELQIIEYFLILKGNLTVKDLIDVYNEYNNKKSIKNIVNKILLLIEKDIFKVTKYTKKNLYDKQPNMFIKLNEELINVKENKVKNLKLSKYLK